MPHFSPITAADAPTLAALHHHSFTEGAWDEPAFTQLLAMQGMKGELLHEEGRAVAFLLYHILLGQADIVTLAVHPDFRRRGLARDLLDRCRADATVQGISQLFLEVAVDNTAALALYRHTGFTEQRLRRAYYTRPNLPPVDALAMVLTLTPLSS